jgi:sulfite reductase alpha subunit-like flavoprotein
MAAITNGISRSILILYGSETGNAQDIAEELGRLCQRLHFRTRVDPLNAVDLVSIVASSPHPHFILASRSPLTSPRTHFSSTSWSYSSSPPPAKVICRTTLFSFGKNSSARDSHLAAFPNFTSHALASATAPTSSMSCLPRLHTTQINSSLSSRFNWAARKLIRRLEQLGGQAFFNCFEADERFNEGYVSATRQHSRASSPRLTHLSSTASKVPLLFGPMAFTNTCLSSILSLMALCLYPRTLCSLRDGLLRLHLKKHLRARSNQIMPPSTASSMAIATTLLTAQNSLLQGHCPFLTAWTPNSWK